MAEPLPGLGLLDSPEAADDGGAKLDLDTQEELHSVDLDVQDEMHADDDDTLATGGGVDVGGSGAGDHQAPPQGQPGREWAWAMLLRGADAATRLVFDVGRESVVVSAAALLPRSQALTVALASYLAADGGGADHEGVGPAHQEQHPSVWVRGARLLLLPVVSAASYIVGSNNNRVLAAIDVFGPRELYLADALAALVFMVAVAAFTGLPPRE